MRIRILFGTESGNSEILAEDIQNELTKHDCSMSAIGQIEPSDLQHGSFYIIVTSTFGSGDLPGAAQPFFDKLERERPDLSHIKFAIFGLGDMVYAETFAKGSEILMNALITQGAVLIGDRETWDASSPELPEDIGLPWAKDVVARAAELPEFAAEAVDS